MSKHRLLSQLFSHKKLQQKFFYYYAGIVFLIILLISLAVYYFQKQMLRIQAEEKALSLTRTLAYTGQNAILSDDYIVLQPLVDSMMDDPDVISVTILDTLGMVIAADRPEWRGRFVTDKLSRHILSQDSLSLESFKNAQGEEIWDTAVPIFDVTRRIGTARIKYSVADTYAGLLQTVLLIGIAALVLSLLLSYRISRSISRPIREAVQLAQEYGKGNFEATIPRHSDDEIGQLIDSLNTLSSELSKLLSERISHEGLIMIGEFAAYIIHDLKNPVNGIHLLADGLHRKLAEDSTLRKYSAEILLASQRVEDFIRRTLDIAKTTEMQYQSIQLNDLVEETINETPIFSSEVLRHYDMNMPKIKGDYSLLRMTVRNLLVNASDATMEKGEISVKTRWNGNAVIEVSDNGVGIPKDRLHTIFRPFFSMKDHGHGLGLAMVKRAVNLHQGTIEVISEEGVGSTFTISLPADCVPLVHKDI
jgi:signal transduction histidine kinase